ncbi:hypothetical protein GQ600_22434 [Phytophthora cactorum]|nr:hypothetical protein GQ600_22434 [Phytophthora cactorum]
MYSGNVARIYNPQPDPLERGPPKRVLREEQHIGEMVAASKKRVTWRFTLGESDRTHEVVLIHSVMSYKKVRQQSGAAEGIVLMWLKWMNDEGSWLDALAVQVVQYDGRQMHFSSTATLGDWNFSMILDGLNVVMEVRINDMESADVPKYDFVIDRIPFRRWDVHRRKKHAITTATYAQPSAPSGNAYGTHRWGPSGAMQPLQNEPQPSRGPFTGSNRGSFTSNSPTSDRTQSLGHQAFQDSRTVDSARHCKKERSVCSEHDRYEFSPATTSGSSSVEAQEAPEINLIDDFGPSVSVSAQSLIFDPLASAKISSAGDSAATNSPQQQQPPPQKQQQAAPVAAIPQPAAYVDPFASVAAPVMTKPSSSINLDPLATQNASSYQQPHQQAIRQMPMGNMGYQHQQQQQHPRVMRGSFTGQQQPVAPGGMGNVNYNISQLMNPANLQTGQQNQKSKSINIDPFASLGR